MAPKSEGIAFVMTEDTCFESIFKLLEMALMASLPVKAPKMFDNSMIVIVNSLNCFVEFSQKEIFKDANVEKND